MKLNAELGGEKHEIEIRRDGRAVFARVDDREYELDASEVERDLYLIKHGADVYQVYAPKDGIVTIDGHQLEIKISDPKKLRGTGSDAFDAEGIAEIKTAMPGKVVRVLVAAGDEVKHGDGVVVVEAMKMQNELKSPKDGVVKEVRFDKGATVNAGDVLAVIE